MPATVTSIKKDVKVFTVYSINSHTARHSSSARPRKKLLQRSWRHSANVMRERSGLDTLCAHLLRNASAVSPEPVQQKPDRFGGEQVGRRDLSHLVETLVALGHQMAGTKLRMEEHAVQLLCLNLAGRHGPVLNCYQKQGADDTRGQIVLVQLGRQVHVSCSSL